MSPDALRLLGKIHRKRGVIVLRTIANACKGQFTDRTPMEVVGELVEEKYLAVQVDGWSRTQKPYTERMRRRLARLAQRRKDFEKPDGKLLTAPHAGLPPETAAWFGYPTKETRQTGRVHYIEDD